MSSLTALVLVVDPERRPSIDPVRVAATLRLTRSEARAAALLAEGRSVLEIADVMGWQASKLCAPASEADLPEAGRVRPGVPGAAGAGAGGAAPRLRACRAAPSRRAAVPVWSSGIAGLTSPIWD